MNHRKLLAFLLALALTLGITAPAHATGAVKDASTTYKSVGTVTQSLSDSSESTDGPYIVDSTNEPGSITVDTINVTVTNIYTIQVNPYGMTIDIPGTTTGKTSNDSIVTAPIRIENSSGVKMRVTATATANPQNGVVLSSKSTRDHDAFDGSEPKQSDASVYLYMQMRGWDESGQTEITTAPAVITKEGGSDPLTVYIAANKNPNPTVSTLQIFGDASIPFLSEDGHYSWYRGRGVNVNVVLSFMPIQDEPGYTVNFDVKDYWWDQGYGLSLPVEIQIAGNSEPLSKNPLVFEKGYQSPAGIQPVKAEQNLTFTVKTGDEPKGFCYLIREITLIREGKDDEVLYVWKKKQPNLVQFTKTINAANVDPNETLSVLVVLEEAIIDS